ncbi:hypothetical protein Tco_0906099, partial [Tanacetum coccineum]
DIPVKADMSWGWHKLLQLCDIVRRYFWMKIGDGASTSLWYDNWCFSSPLSRFFSHRDITNEGFHIQTKEADLISNGNWIWPQPWISKAPILGQITVPNIDGSRADVIQWKASNGSLSVFSIAKVWEELHPRGNQVDCCQDSHAHLFFECAYAPKVWTYVREMAAMDTVPPCFHDILLYLRPMANKRTACSIFGKLILAASSYFIWLERNNRIFKNARKSPEEVRDIIIVTVRLKLLMFHFKDTVMVNQLLSKWKMPKQFRLYV